MRGEQMIGGPAGDAQPILIVDATAGDLGDRLFLSASSGFASDGMVITRDGVRFGTVDPVEDGQDGAALKIFLDSGADREAIDALSSALRFETIADDPASGTIAATVRIVGDDALDLDGALEIEIAVPVLPFEGLGLLQFVRSHLRHRYHETHRRKTARHAPGRVQDGDRRPRPRPMLHPLHRPSRLRFLWSPPEPGAATGRGGGPAGDAQPILIVDANVGDLGGRLFLSASSGFASDGMVILRDGVRVGTVDPAEDGQDGAALKIVLDAGADREAIDAVPSALRFETIGDNPASGTIAATVRIVGGDALDLDGALETDVAVPVLPFEGLGLLQFVRSHLRHRYYETRRRKTARHAPGPRVAHGSALGEGWQIGAQAPTHARRIFK